MKQGRREPCDPAEHGIKGATRYSKVARHQFSSLLLLPVRFFRNARVASGPTCNHKDAAAAVAVYPWTVNAVSVTAS